MSLEKEIFKDVTMGETPERYMDIFSGWADAFEKISYTTTNERSAGTYSIDINNSPRTALTFTASIYADNAIPPLEMTVKASVEKEGFRISVVTEDESILEKVTEKMLKIDEGYPEGHTGRGALLTKGRDAETLRTTIMEVLTTAPAFLAHTAKAAVLEMEGKPLPKIIQTPDDMENYYCNVLSDLLLEKDNPAWRGYSFITQDPKGVWFSAKLDADKNAPFNIQIETCKTEQDLAVTLQTNDNEIIKHIAQDMVALGTELRAISSAGKGDMTTIGTTVVNSHAATTLLDSMIKATQDSPLFLNHIRATAITSMKGAVKNKGHENFQPR